MTIVICSVIGKQGSSTLFNVHIMGFSQLWDSEHFTGNNDPIMYWALGSFVTVTIQQTYNSSYDATYCSYVIVYYGSSVSACIAISMWIEYSFAIWHY